jgi:transcriptional regulator with XRE-family HTH domain
VGISNAKRTEIRRFYKTRRVDLDLTQDDVTERAGLLVGRFWKIENGRSLPTDGERKAIARVLKVAASALPGVEHAEPQAVAS